MKIFAILTTLTFFSLAIAQQPAKPATTHLTVTFAADGDREWWVVSKTNQPLNAPVAFKDKKTVIDLEPTYKGGQLLIEDHKTGNLAAYPVDTVMKKPDLTVSDADFKFAGHVQVKATKDGKPIYGVTIKLKDAAGREQAVVLAASTAGSATFDRVAHGKLTIDIVRPDGKDSHEETLAPARTDPVQTYNYVVTANVPVGQAPVAAPATTVVAPAPKPAPSPVGIGTFVLYALVLVVAGAVLFGVLKLIQGKNQKVADLMQQMGVQLPDAATGGKSVTISEAQPAPPLVPEGHCPFCGQQRDANGNCGCTLGTSATGAAVASPAGKPRLVGLQGSYVGSIFDIAADSITVGREPGNTIALSQDTTISRQHAKIAKANGSYVVTDFGSSNGTFVNDVRISGDNALQPGDTVQFGMSKFKFEA